MKTGKKQLENEGIGIMIGTEEGGTESDDRGEKRGKRAADEMPEMG